MGHFHSMWFPQDLVLPAPPPPPQGPHWLPHDLRGKSKAGGLWLLFLRPAARPTVTWSVSGTLKPAVPGGQDSHQWEARPGAADPAARSASLLSQTWGAGGVWPFPRGWGRRRPCHWFLWGVG